MPRSVTNTDETTVVPRVEGTTFIGAPKGFIGHHPTFTVHNGSLETHHILRPIKYCDGVYVFECPYEQIPPADKQRMLFKREYNHAANEIKLATGSSGGKVFINIIRILEVVSSTPVSEELFPYGLRAILSHENLDRVVGIEIEMVEKLLRGEFDDIKGINKLFTSYGRQITEAVMHGPNRSEYLFEPVDAMNHLSVMHLGYAALELLPPEVLEGLIGGELEEDVRIGDVLVALGLNVPDFVAKPIVQA
ncbi:hypothetical protein KC878_03140 [Candidatus Saccharibacteria bacterium]|nr:hypothetical protein [Candidatus Saccharibacteria bacterium]MCB9821718.1 hypothetical protein [Candidatus Nomurabacteria bacterium]